MNAVGSPPTGHRRGGVVWVNQYAVQPGDPGGTRYYDFALALRRLGWEVEIVASDLSLTSRTYRKRSSKFDPRVSRETVSDVQFTYLWAGSYRRNDWRRLLSMLLFGISAAGLLTIRRIRYHTIFIGSSPHLFAAFGTWLASVVRHQPFIFEVRDLWPESYAEVSGGGEGGIPYRLMRWMADLMYRRSDAIIVLAEANRERVATRGADPAKISCIPNGVNLQEFTEPANEVLPRTGAVRFIYAGAHGPANGLDVVVRACAALERDGADDIEVLLVGDGPAKAELASMVKQLGVQNIEMRDPIPKNKIPELLRTADVGLMILAPVELFSYGVSPNKLFDYLAANLPVLTNVPGLAAEIVRAAGAGYACDAGDPEALAAGMRLMASEIRADPTRFHSGRNFVEQHSDRQMLAGQLDELLQRVLVAERRNRISGHVRGRCHDG